MAIYKEITEDEFYLYLNGKLIYKKWFKTGFSYVFDKMPYCAGTFFSIYELDGQIVFKSNLKTGETET